MKLYYGSVLWNVKKEHIPSKPGSATMECWKKAYSLDCHNVTAVRYERTIKILLSYKKTYLKDKRKEGTST